MAKHTIAKCPRRGHGAGIDMAAEFDLCHGHVFGIRQLELASVADMLAHWRRWGDEITRRWIAAYPGSRPFAMYVLGRIPPCSWQHDTPALRHPLRPIAGCEVVIPDIAWHMREPEVDHLEQLGLLARGELAAAEDRLADPDPQRGHRYEQIARDDR
jgi:hypothetical protein